MVEKAFLNVDNYLNFFKEIDDIYKAKENALSADFAEINSVYGHLLQDDKIKKPNEFLFPEIPKNKKGMKEKQESSRAPRKNTSTSNEPITTNTTLNKMENINDDAFRRSSRIASKKILSASHSISESIGREILTNTSTSSVQSVRQSKHINDTGMKKKNSKNTEDSLMMCLAHSTPLVLSPNDKKCDTTSKTPDEVLSLLKNEENADSVKKRIEEFEKRAVKNHLPSKLPLKTPDKKNKVQTEVNDCENRSLRSNKILQDRNVNVESSQTRDIAKKNPSGMKINNPSTEMKAMVRGAKTMNQRQNENNPNLESSNLKKNNNGRLVPAQKKYFNQVKKIPKINNNSSNSQNETCTAEIKRTDSKENINSVLEPQYKIDHVSENESSEDEEHPKRQIPNWATKEMREYPLKVQAWINKREIVYPWFYNKNIKNPKSEELFSTATKMRPRTSSAVWNNKIYFK